MEGKGPDRRGRQACAHTHAHTHTFSSLLSQLPSQQCSLQATATTQCESKDHKHHTPSSESPWRHWIPNKAGSRVQIWCFSPWNYNGFKTRSYEGHLSWVAASRQSAACAACICGSVQCRRTGQRTARHGDGIQGPSRYISVYVLIYSQPKVRQCSVHLSPYLNSFLVRTHSTACDVMRLSLVDLYRKQRDDCACPLCVCVI